MQVVVCGAGAIGASVAYFLTAAGADVTIVDRAGPAAAASGKSGGFLALDWCDGQPLEALARRSFHLHQSLAGTLDADWGYRTMTTYAGVCTPRPARGPVGWISDEVAITQRLGGPDTTAQVHPARFTEALVDAALSRGATMVPGAVTGLRRSEDGRVTGVHVGGTLLPSEAVVVAMGPWSVLAAEWLPLPPVYGIKGHSLVYATGSAVPAEALFLEWHDGEGTLTPEVFPRADGTTYVCALSSQTALPLDPRAVAPDPGAFQRLEAACAHIAPAFAASPIAARQACHRPVCADGWPLIGPIPAAPGAYIATGHSVWGILNAPATGEAVAGLIATGRSPHVDLSALSPARLPPLTPRAAAE